MQSMKFRDGNFYTYMVELLEKRLKDGAIQNKLIAMHNKFDRGIGKTTTLIYFAKANNLTVILANCFTNSINDIRNKFHYPYITTHRLTLQQGTRGMYHNAIVDEGGYCCEEIEEMFNIITGFTTDHDMSPHVHSSWEQEQAREDRRLARIIKLEDEVISLRERLKESTRR